MYRRVIGKFIRFCQNVTKYYVIDIYLYQLSCIFSSMYLLECTSPIFIDLIREKIFIFYVLPPVFTCKILTEILTFIRGICTIMPKSDKKML